MDKKSWLDIVMYILLGLALVAIVTNAAGFAQAVSSVGDVITGESKILTGK